MFKKAKKILSTRKRRLFALIILFIFLTPFVARTLLVTTQVARANSLLAFNEGYGTKVNDSSGSAEGTITGAAWQTEDLCYSGKCLYFDGSSWINFGDEDSYDFAAGDTFTIQFWFRHGPASSAETIVQKYETTESDGGYRIRMESNGTISFGVDDANDNFADDNITSTDSYDNYKWHHVSAVKDGTTGIYLYIDGIQVASDETIGSTGTLANDDNFYIGDSDGTDNGDEFIGFIDEVKIYTSTARTETEIKSDLAGSTTNRGISASFGAFDEHSFLSNGLMGYWKMDDKVSGDAQIITDYSGNGNHGTTVDGVNDTGMDCTVSGKFGTGCDLDGTDDYISISNGDTFDYEDEGFSISLWVNTTQDCSGSKDYWGQRNNNPDVQVGCNTVGSDNVAFFSPDSSSAEDDNIWLDGNTVINDGSWHLITAVKRGHADATLEIYVDGELDATMEHNYIGDFDFTADNANIGQFGTDQFWADANMDEVRVYGRPLTPSEIKILYQWAPGPVGYWKLDEGSGTTANDSSGFGNTGSFTASTPVPQWIQGKTGGALKFDSSGGAVNVGNDSIINITGAMTISAWVYIDDIPGDLMLVGKQGGGSSRSWILTITDSSEKAEFMISSDGTDIIQVPTQNALSTGRWYHLTGVYEPSTALRIYVNGILDNSLTTGIPSSQFSANGLNACIGGRGNCGFSHSGNLDEVRIYNYARTPQQIVEDMNAGHPTGGSPIGSAVLHWKFDEMYGDTAYDNSPTGNNGNLGESATCPGNTTNCPEWTTSGKIGAALDFAGPGSDHRVDATSLDGIDFRSSTQDFTVAIWSQRDTNNIQEIIVDNTESSSSIDNGWLLEFTSSDTVRCKMAGTDITSSSTITDNEWHHIACVIDRGGNGQIYIDGKADGSPVSISEVSYSTTKFPRVGMRITPKDTQFDGRLDDFRLYNSALTAHQVAVVMNAGSASAFGTLGATEESTLTDGAASAPIGHWRFDEKTGTTANDYSGNGKSGSFTGDPEWKSSADCKIGACLKFNGSDGTDDFVSVTDDATGLYDFESTDSFSVSAWIKGEQIAERQYIAFKGDPGWVLQARSNANNGDAYFQIRDGTETPNVTSNGTSILDDQWHHVVGVRDVSEDNLYVYVDGKLTGTIEDTTAGNLYDGTNRPLLIGGSDAFPSDLYIDEVKIYSEALTQSQVSYLYNRGEPIGYWKMDDNVSGDGQTVKDSSQTGNDGLTVNNSTNLDCTVGGKFNLSCQFDGTDDYINIPDNDIYDFGTGDFTVSAWIKSTQDCASDWKIYVARYSGAGAFILRCEDNGTIGNASFFVRDSGGIDQNVVGTSNITDGNWHHIVGIKVDYPNTTLKIYVDGKLENTAIQTYSGTFDNDVSINIGRLNNNSRYANAQIDEVRIYNYALSETQIRQIMNTGAVFFGPSTGSP